MFEYLLSVKDGVPLLICCILFTILTIVYYKSANKSKIVCLTSGISLAVCMLSMVAMSYLYVHSRDINQDLRLSSAVDSDYTVYINGCEASLEHCDIYSYPYDSMEFDDEAKEILITTIK